MSVCRAVRRPLKGVELFDIRLQGGNVADAPRIAPQAAQGREAGRGRTATGREATDATQGVLGGTGDGAHGEDWAQPMSGGDERTGARG